MVHPLEDQVVWPIPYSGLAGPCAVWAQGGGLGDAVDWQLEQGISIWGTCQSRHHPRGPQYVRVGPRIGSLPLGGLYLLPVIQGTPVKDLHKVCNTIEVIQYRLYQHPTVWAAPNYFLAGVTPKGVWQHLSYGKSYEPGLTKASFL